MGARRGGLLRPSETSETGGRGVGGRAGGACFLGSPRGVRPLFRRRHHYSVKMGDRSVFEEITSVVVPVKSITVHPRFSTFGTIHHDVALLQLDHPVNFTLTIHPICIPDVTFKVAVGTRCWVTGWGRKEEFGETGRQRASWRRGRQPFPWTRRGGRSEGQGVGGPPGMWVPIASSPEIGPLGRSTGLGHRSGSQEKYLRVGGGGGGY